MLQNTGTADTAALTVDGAQPVWMTLNDARQRAFTGEVVFEADPEVLAYLDNGTVYYAERASDVSLGRRLLDAGVIDIAQLERGTVRVGDIEHLGRLFDRDPSVDRDAVVVVAETSTQGIIAELANREITTVRVTAYRHHPSGVHRWFVAPLDPSAVSRPISAVAQLDTTVVDDLPGLSFSGADADELSIEWDDQIGEIDHLGSNGEFDVSLLDVVNGSSVDESPQLDAGVFELSLDLAEFTDHADETVDVVVDTRSDDDPSGFEFSVVWPDGSAEPAIDSPSALDDAAIAANGLAAVTDAGPSFTQLDDGDLHFEMPPLTLTDEPELADADVPDDVAEAVRRAIAAIESAAIATPNGAPQPQVTTKVTTQLTTQLPDIAEITPIEPVETAPAVETVAAAPDAGPGGFAPPTMATSAEVLYAQMADDGSSVDTTAAAVVAPALAGSPAGGVASVVFVDEPVELEDDGDNDRSSALRRLIGGLRRKDH